MPSHLFIHIVVMTSACIYKPKYRTEATTLIRKSAVICNQKTKINY